MAAAKEDNLSDILRDFKKFTSKQIITAIKNNEQNAGKNGCFPSLSNKEKRTAVTVNTNSGDSACPALREQSTKRMPQPSIQRSKAKLYS